MTDLKQRALEIAASAGGDASAVVDRATEYYTFLTGSNTPTRTPSSDSVAGKTQTTTAQPPGGGTKGANASPNPKANGTATAAGKTNSTTAAKATAAPKAAKAPTGATVASDTKAPGGKYTYADVVAKLRDVQGKSGREEAFKILAEDGGGVKSVRDLKPTNYDAVVEGCNNVLSDEGGTAGGSEDPLGGEVDDPTAQPDRDEMGLS